MDSDSKLKCEQMDSELNLIGMNERCIPNQSKSNNSTEIRMESSRIHVEASVNAKLHIDWKPNQELIDSESNSFAIGLLLYCYLYVFCIVVLLLFY